MSTIFDKYLIQAPTAKREFRTIEIHHPDFTAPLRFVQDFFNQNLLLEADAPRNPGATVLFTALSMKIKEPGTTPNASPVLTVNLGAVGNEVQDQLDKIGDSGLFTPIEVIYRRYYEDDVTGPVLVFNLSAATLNFESYSAVGFTATDIDFASRPAGEIYTLERFPGLANL